MRNLEIAKKWAGTAFRRLRPLLSFSCALIISITMPIEASAFEFFGIKFFEEPAAADIHAVIADPQPYTVDISVTGNTTLDSAVQNASALWDGRNAPASGAAGLLATARSDYRRIVAALYTEGYYGGAVTIAVDGREATTLPPDSTLGTPALVVIRVDTGPLFHFGALKIANRSSATNADLAPHASVGFLTGEIARSGAVRRAAQLAVRNWRERGYPKAKVADQDVQANHKTNLVDVELTIAPGPLATIGMIRVDGAVDMDADFIIRHTGLIPGKQYDPEDIRRARERLNDLEVFGAIKIAEADNVQPDGTLPLTILVQERKPRRVGAGATFSTTDGLGIETFWLHRNLFGEGERLRFDARMSGLGYPVDFTNFDYYFASTFTKPGIITPDTDLIAKFTAQRTVLTRYTEVSAEGNLGLMHEITPELSAAGGIELKRANFNDALYGNRDFSVFGAYGTLAYDTRNDPNDATKGIFTALTVEPFYEAEYGNTALALSAEARAYISLVPNDQIVLAGRVKAGLLFGPSLAQTPPDKLFFAGGGGSVRGFPYRSIGVDGLGGTVTGGKFATEASLEARIKVTENIGVVGFVDAGYVTADRFVGLADGARLGIGAGLRYYTGFGPLRLDVAVPINKRAGDPNYAIYVGIGQAF